MTHGEQWILRELIKSPSVVCVLCSADGASIYLAHNVPFRNRLNSDDRQYVTSQSHLFSSGVIASHLMARHVRSVRKMRACTERVLLFSILYAGVVCACLV